MLLTNPARESNWMISFNITIPGGQQIDITPWIQSFTIPELTLSPVTTDYGPGRFRVQGDSPDQSRIDIRLILDENWEILTILYAALYGQARTSIHRNILGNITFFAMDTYNNPRFKLEFANIVCTSVSSLEMNTTQTDNNLIVQASFESSGTKFRKISTRGEYSLGSGPNTKGLYRADGTSSTQEIYDNNMVYTSYTGRLFKSGSIGPDGKIDPTEWKVGLLEDDFYTVLATDNDQQPLEGTCGVAGARL